MLLTRELIDKLRANAEQSSSGARDHFPIVKLFAPDGAATWLFTELLPDEDTLFGLCDLGLGSPEIGYASLAELSARRGRFGLLIERDRHFGASKPLSEYAAEARRKGRIVA